MIHPLLKDKLRFFSFLGTWTFIMIVHFLILFFDMQYPLMFCISDSLFSGISYALLTLGLWFTIRFGIQKQHNMLTAIANNLLLFVISTSVWLFFSWIFIASINASWSVLFFETLPFRILAVLFLYIGIIGLYYAVSYYESLQDKLLQENMLRNLVKEAQLNELRSQLHPHFLFNSLNSINSLTISKPEKAGEMIVKLSEFLRYSLSRKGHSMAGFEKELHHIQLYLDIEKVRFGKRLEFHATIEPACLLWPIPLMLLQPLIENAVKHGVYNTNDTVHINLIASIADNNLIVSIQNNFDADSPPEKGTGTGIQNVRERLRLVYGPSVMPEIIVKDQLFTIRLTIPKVLEKNENI